MTRNTPKKKNKKQPPLNREQALREQALTTLDEIITRSARYEKINDQLQKLQRDFTPFVQSIDSKISFTITTLLDLILGDSLASYVLWERDPIITVTSKSGRKKSYKVKDVAGLRKYLAARDRQDKNNPL